MRGRKNVPFAADSPSKKASIPMIYFDHAATSYPKPPEVFTAIEQTLCERGGNPGRSSHRLALAAAEQIYETREKLAVFFDSTSPESFVFTQNATHALNLALKSAVLPGDHVLISDLEHNAVFRPVYRLFRDRTISFSVFRTAGDILANIESVRQDNSRILICTHVSNVNGRRLPIEKIADYCRQKGLYFILDASQSAGHTPISLRALDPDALCAPAHKGLLGIQGAGFVYLRSKEGLCEYMEGGSGSHSLSPEMPDALPERYEAGTPATPAIAALGAGINALTKLGGAEAAEVHEAALAKRGCEMVSSVKGTELYASEGGSLFSFNLRGYSSETLAELLNEKNIAVRGGFHCAPLAHRALRTGEHGAVRVSFGITNREEELDSFYRALCEIAFNRRR